MNLQSPQNLPKLSVERWLSFATAESDATWPRDLRALQQACSAALDAYMAYGRATRRTASHWDELSERLFANWNALEELAERVARERGLR